MAPSIEPVCRSLLSPHAPLEPLSQDELARIHAASLDVLQDVGMDILHPEARDILAKAGAWVDDERVRFPRELVEEAVARAPSRFRLWHHDESAYLEFGGNAINLGLIASAPYCSDLAGGRRPGTIADLAKLTRLADNLPAVRMICGYPVEPQDLPAPTRHLDAVHAFLTLSTKPCHAYSLGGARIRDALEMIKIVRGVDEAALAARPSLISIINTSSPLRLDHPMADGMMVMAQAGQPVGITPFTLSGAMSPVTLAGALVQQNAEALAAVALMQIVAPGAPVLYGGFTSNVDMRSGSPAFGTPEYARAALAGGQLARYEGLPYRSSNVNASNTVDAQAAYESMTALWAAIMGHANLIMHGAGWLEGGLTSSYEKVVLDAEMYDRIEATLTPLPEEAWNFDPADLAAMPRPEEALTEDSLQPLQEAYASWRPEPAVQRAAREVQRLVADHRPPPLDPARLAALDGFVARRKHEGGAEAA
ncbi:trimethylamine methyltransferase family protein [Ferruginivarius sediminum]|nr:trimethylamine methyltransferase family protein [Ferruginivarius sediminum]